MTEELNRHQIRTRAFQTLFAMNANPEADRQVVTNNYCLMKTAKRRSYLEKLVAGVLEKQTELDDQIKKSI